MLKTIRNSFLKRKQSNLKVTPGESLRDAIIKAEIESAQASDYAAGNTT